MLISKICQIGVIGSVRTRILGDTCHIGKLIVHPNWQNKGMGTRLMAEAETMNQDAARFELFTGSHSTRNLSLYHNLGYQEFRREQLSSKVELVYLEKINSF